MIVFIKPFWICIAFWQLVSRMRPYFIHFIFEQVTWNSGIKLCHDCVIHLNDIILYLFRLILNIHEMALVWWPALRLIEIIIWWTVMPYWWYVKFILMMFLIIVQYGWRLHQWYIITKQKNNVKSNKIFSFATYCESPQVPRDPLWRLPARYASSSFSGCLQIIHHLCVIVHVYIWLSCLHFPEIKPTTLEE